MRNCLCLEADLNPGVTPIEGVFCFFRGLGFQKQMGKHMGQLFNMDI